MHRYLILAGLLASLTTSGIVSADEPSANPVDAAIIERLDAILSRLETIEKRLAIVEADTRLSADWTVDERGIMRLPNGHPVGFWGIDWPHRRAVQR